MRNPILTGISVLAGVICFLTPSWVYANPDLAQRLVERVEAFHEGAAPVDHELRLVYFHPADAEPQADYEARLTRILSDIQDFFQMEMKRLGMGDKRLPVEMDGEQVKLHVVKGKEPGSAYDYDSGEKVLGEMREALKGRINFDQDFVLVIGGLCQKDSSGKYKFHAPYYGWPGSGQRFGLCFAADCELMDTEYFATTSKKIRYWEHQGDFEKTLGAFNRLYIGGLAHELGHGLGLPHNSESGKEAKQLGTALMGSGNHTYREEKIGKKGSFLTLASGVRLAAHPLLTQSNRARFAPTSVKTAELNFARGGNELTISGKVEAFPPAYAAIAYIDPEGRGDYDARTWVAEVKEDGTFSIPTIQMVKGSGQLRLTFCHFNGGASTPVKLPYLVGEDGMPNTAELSGRWTLLQAEQAYMDGDKQRTIKLVEAELKRDPESDYAPRLSHLLQLTYGQGVIKLENVEDDVAFLSDVEWKSAEVGWGKPARNQYYSGPGVKDSVCIMLGGQFHSKGLYAHAPSHYVFELDGSWDQFATIVGLQQGVASNGSAVFIVVGDGKELFRSDLLKGNKTMEVEVPISGVKKLELITESGKENNHMCWSVWGSPLLTR